MCGPGRLQVGLCSDIRRPEDSTIITKKAKKLAGVFFSKALRTACTDVAQMNAAIEKNEFALVKGLPEAPTIAHDKGRYRNLGSIFKLPSQNMRTLPTALPGMNGEFKPLIFSNRARL